MKKIAYILYWLVSLTWGIIMSIIGLTVGFILYLAGHEIKHLGPNVYFVVGESWGGVNLGPVFLTCRRGEDRTKFHEAGHGLQNIILGPLFPFLVAIPSAIRYWYRELKYYKKGKVPPTNYDDIWFEGQATSWGNKIYNKN